MQSAIFLCKVAMVLFASRCWQPTYFAMYLSTVRCVLAPCASHVPAAYCCCCSYYAQCLCKQAQISSNAVSLFLLAGEVLDHVALGGTLNHVAAAPDIWSQFPLICPIIAKIAKGHAAKVTMHRAYLRSGPGHHYIVHPHLAEMYFGGKCTGLACELVVKRFKQRSTHDLYNYTPYKQYADRYAETVTAPGWRAQRWQTWTKVHHFKWFSAVLDNLQARMVRESGDCLLSINEHSCRPVSQFWHEIARQYHKINSTQRINIKELQCQEGIDTLWNWSVR